MIKKFFALFFLLILLSCGGVELVLKNDQPNDIKNKALLLFEGRENQKFSSELFSFFGNKKEGYKYILITSFVEKKENKIIKKKPGCTKN